MKTVFEAAKARAKMNNRGQAIALINSTTGALLTLAVLMIAVFLALVSLQDSSIFTAGSQAKNDTDLIINNITSGATTFAGNIPTVFSILGAVLIISAIVILIVIIRRANFGGGGGGL